MGLAAHLFFTLMPQDDHQIQVDIEHRLAEEMPQVELLACERIAAERLRLTIDHPDGVTLDLCERVTKEMRDLLEHYALEVSSPGPERPLVKPEHFRRYLGRRARIRTKRPFGRSAARAPVGRAPDRSFTGELVGASDAEVTVAADSGVVAIPYEEIHRSHLVSRGEDA